MTKSVLTMFCGALLASGWWAIFSLELAREALVIISVFTALGTCYTLAFIGIETAENWNK